MNVTVLAYVEAGRDRKPDSVVPQVVKALKANGHEVSTLCVHGDMKRLISALERRRPELIFNLLETFGDTQFGEVGSAGLLDLLGFPYTGAGPGELFITGNKVLTKKILAYEGINFPRFAVFSKDANLETGGNLKMPLFVKPVSLDGSLGVDAKGLVHDAVSMMRQVVMIHDKWKDAALVEEYIEGREFYVGIIGNAAPVALPPIEMDFGGLPDGAPHVLDSKAKWVGGSAAYKGTRSVLAEIPDELRSRIQKVAIDAYRALRVRDYGRIDLRVTPAGEPYVIEVNASCYLDEQGEFATAARAAGIEYVPLIQKIVDLALERRSQARPKTRAPVLTAALPEAVEAAHDAERPKAETKRRRSARR